MAEKHALRWELTGAGLERFGRDGKASVYEVRPPGSGEVLARVDACGICFSDIKILNLGGEHPRLKGRDLAREPVVMGHEVALTIEAVGPQVNAPFRPGDRAVVQADIYYRGQGMAMGYRLPGGFSQYVTIGREILEGDEGRYLLPIPSDLGYAEAALCEPWACVEASYRYRPRRGIKPHGELLILAIDRPLRSVRWPEGSASPDRVVVVCEHGDEGLPDPWPRSDVRPWRETQALLSRIAVGQARFDDIVVLGSAPARLLETVMPALAPGGVLCLVGGAPEEPVAVDLGRVHYEDVGIVGTAGNEVARAYTDTREAELVAGGVAWFIGAGGPMGQMHLQRALTMEQPPRKIVVTQHTGPRLTDLTERFGRLARERGIEFAVLNPKELSETELIERLHAETRRGAVSSSPGAGFDDIVCLVPSVPTLEMAPKLLAPGGGVNVFAGLPVGTTVRLDLGPIVERRVRFWGTSGSRIADLRAVIEKVAAGELETASVVAAVAGIHGVRDGLAAVREGRFLGKIVIYPQLTELPLLSVAEVAARYPPVGERLTRGRYWNREAEAELLRSLRGTAAL